MDDDVPVADFCYSIISRYGNSDKEEHQRLCADIGVISEAMKDQNLPLTPLSYFCATSASLGRLVSEQEPSAHAVGSLLTILAMLLPQISAPILVKQRDFLSELVVKVLLVFKGLSPEGVVSGLKCVTHILIVACPAVSTIYGCLLGYLTDSNPKVRRQAQLSTRDVLQSFQGTPLLQSASEGITKIFERSLLLAGSASTSASKGPTGGQEVLYLLDALKECLPLMSMKFTTSILSHFKVLLQVRQPLVTKRITDSLSIICRLSNKDVSPEVLLDLLCSLALSVSTDETSVDAMTFTARLLDVGMKKVYSLNRDICIVKLPLVFSALKDILSSEHEEAIFAATEALRGLIMACIDESLVNQGVEQIILNADKDERKSGPTVVEKVCVAIESLLDYSYAHVWDMSFKVVNTMFDRIGRSSYYLLRGTLKNLGEMQKLPDEDFPFRKQLHECLGSAVGSMGPQNFLSLIPLKLDADDQSESNIWLFPILKQYIVGADLSFFTKAIVSMVRPVKQKSKRLEQEGRMYSSRSTDALIYSLWSLFPSFCNFPLDTAKSFKSLERLLCDALREEPDIRGIICSGLHMLIQQNKSILEEKDNLLNAEVTNTPTKCAMAYYTHEVATDNLSVLRSSSRALLTVLFDIFVQSSKDDGGCLQSTISEFASISDKEIISRFFKATLRRMEASSKVAMQIDNSSSESSSTFQWARLFDLAVSLLPGLNDEEIDFLYVEIVRANLQHSEGLIQKKAYKVLSLILKKCDNFISNNFEDLHKLMLDVLPACHHSAKRHRLDCLYFLVIYASKDGYDEMRPKIIGFLTEIILALKEANKKTRNRAYDVLVQIGHACGDEDKDGKKEHLVKFFDMVAGGLTGKTPHMISASVKGLARLAYEFSDLVSTAYHVLPSTFLLLRRKNREISKANLGLLKVLVAKSPAEGLQAYLRCIVEGLLEWQDNTKNHFKAKVKLLLEMLVKKCGLDAVKEVMPEEHMKLLSNIRKMKERKEKKHAATSEESKSRHSVASTSRHSRWNHTRIFSDYDDEDIDGSNDEYMDSDTILGSRNKASAILNSKASLVRSKKARRAAKSLPEDLFEQLEDEPLDLLDRRKIRSSLRSSSENVKRKAESDEELELDSEGRLIIREKTDKKREKPGDTSLETISQAGSYVSNSSRKTQKKRKIEAGWAYTGKEYSSKKAGGDVKRKDDKLEPYAYWPLDRKMMSRRPEHRASARKGMASVVKLTKKLEGRSASSALSISGSKFKRKQKNGIKKKRVRRQAQLSTRDVLQSFQGTPLLQSASEGITKIFERSLLLAGSASTSASKGPTGGQEVLYLLDALKECLPLMSMKFTTSILSHFKVLLQVRQPLVTKRITDSLSIICRLSNKDVSPEVLLDLLCSLALSVSTDETSVDAMTFTARLLDVGMKKVYSLNRDICIVKLPLVFSALKDILSSEHEEAIFAATEALRGLIMACIDESLVNQGVEQIILNADKDERKSGPTVVEKVCVAIESLLDYSYAHVWDMSFKVVNTMFDRIGRSSYYLLRGTLKNLGEMQKLPDEDFPFRKQLHECLGSAVGSMGPQNFLSLIPLKLDVDDQSESNIWLFPILKQYIVGADLSFFTKAIVSMVRPVKQKSKRLEQEGRMYSSRSTDALIYSLWSLFPSFCNFPLDTAKSFKSLERLLCDALREEPDIRGIICSGLHMLIQQNKSILEEKDNLLNAEVTNTPTKCAMAYYTHEVATDNLSVLRSSSRALLTVLFDIFVQSSKDDGGCLQSTISEFASISDKEIISRFFKATLRRMEASSKVAMQIDNSSSESSSTFQWARLFDLAVSLLPGLNDEEIDFLYVEIVRANLQHSEGLIQKKAYKVLSLILKKCDNFISNNFEDLHKLMLDVLPACHHSAKRHRLDCLYFLVIYASKDGYEEMRPKIIGFLTEIILALKEANKKTRNRAYDVLVQIGHACGDEDKDGKKEHLVKFFDMVAGGLTGKTPHMISASVKGLARLAYEFSDLVSTAYHVLPSTFLLLRRKNREISKANLGLLKVLVAKSPAEGLQAYLRCIVEGLLEWQDNTKNHFKAKVKLLLEMLVKKCGLDAVKEVMPEEHMKLLSNIRKMKERKEKKHAATSEESKSRHSVASTSRHSRWNHTRIFSDYDDEDIDGSNAEYMDSDTILGSRNKASAILNSKASLVRSKKARRAAKSLPEDLFEQLEDERLDLLDRRKIRSSLRSSSENVKRKAESDEELELDSEGRLIIREKTDKKREKPGDTSLETISQAGSYVSNSSRKTQKKRKIEAGWAYTGKEYSSKKAGGDVKRKDDKLEPYAYWPLDRKMMSRRPEHRASARKGMASVVKLTKKLEGRSASSALSISGSKFKRKQKNGIKKKRI